jgi:putative transposase
MRTLFTSFLAILADATRRELARQVQYLKVENQILRAKLPKRITVTPAERTRLIRFGKPLGSAIRALITIVTPRTFSRWVQVVAKKRRPAKRGRPPLIALRDLVVMIARKTGFGYTKVLGEIKKLTRRKVSRQFVINVMRENGFEPGPKRGEKTWDHFLKTHARTLWQCDFFYKRVLTLAGVREFFVLAFIHVGTRRVFVTPATMHPTEEWCQLQAKAFCRRAQANGPPLERVYHDRDTKYGRGFDAELAMHGVKGIRIAPRSPNMQAYIERWIQSIQVECLDRFIVLGEKHMNYLVAEWVRYYHIQRPHQSMGNQPLTETPTPPEDVPKRSQVRCVKIHGGHLTSFERRAA